MNTNGAAAFSRNCKFDLILSKENPLTTETWYKLISELTTGYYKLYFNFSDRTCIVEILKKEIIKVITNIKVHLKIQDSSLYFKFEDSVPTSVVIDYFDGFIYNLIDETPDDITIPGENNYEYCDPSKFGNNETTGNPYLGEFYLKDVKFDRKVYEDFETGNLTADNFEVKNIVIGNWKFTFDSETEKIYLSCNTAK